MKKSQEKLFSANDLYIIQYNNKFRSWIIEQPEWKNWKNKHYPLHNKPKSIKSTTDKIVADDTLTYIVTGKQIGRASCRERVSSPV